MSKWINAIFLYSSWMPFYNLFKLLLAYDVIIYILNYVIYLINSHICFLQPLLRSVSSTYHCKDMFTDFNEMGQDSFLIRSFT